MHTMYADMIKYFIIMICCFFVCERDSQHLIWFATISNSCEQYKSNTREVMLG